MQSMTVDQLRAASDSGGVSGVILKGMGGAFVVQIDTRNGSTAVLVKSRSSEPRRGYAQSPPSRCLYPLAGRGDPGFHR